MFFLLSKGVEKFKLAENVLPLIQDVDEFVSLSEKCSITSVHQLILCSEWVPSEWESKQLIKTSQ